MEEKEVGLHQITLRYTDGVYHGTKSYPQARLTTYDVRLCVRFADGEPNRGIEESALTASLSVLINFLIGKYVTFFILIGFTS